MQRLDHQGASGGEQCRHGCQQANDVLMQQREVGADQVVVAANVDLRFGQLRIRGVIHHRRACRAGRVHQRRVAVDADRVDAAVGQCAQQPSFAAPQVEHTFGLATEDGQQDRLVGDLATAFDGATAHGLGPGLGIVLPALQQGVFRVRHAGFLCWG
ncbi:hypothetical protein D3C80_1673030 [compost metagenome]